MEESCFASIILWYVILSILSPLISSKKGND
jgi:hypothetical protein